jgi:hypothetical protein
MNIFYDFVKHVRFSSDYSDVCPNWHIIISLLLLASAVTIYLLFRCYFSYLPGYSHRAVLLVAPLARAAIFSIASLVATRQFQR